MLGPNEKPVLVGIVPVGFLARCEKGHPVVFARVDSFLDWIEAKSGIEIS